MPVSAYYQNVRGLRTKLVDFRCNSSASAFDIIFVNESWLNDGVYDSEVVDIDQFQIFRRDRSSSASLKRDGGGSFIAVRRDLRPSLLPEFQSNAEDVWIQISIGGQRIFMCCVYIPPGDAAAISSFSSNLGTVRDKIMDDIVLIVGDFNLSSVLWEYNSSQLFFEPINVEDKYFDLI